MNIKAIAFDTGGTVLDWHSGVCKVFSEIGTSHGLIATGMLSRTTTGVLPCKASSGK